MRTVRISDIKAYIKESDADLSVVKLGGVWRLVDHNGDCTVIQNEAQVLEVLKEDYPISELDYGDLNDIPVDDFINDEELISTGGK